MFVIVLVTKIAAMVAFVLSAGHIGHQHGVPDWARHLVKGVAVVAGMFLLRDVLKEFGASDARAMTIAICVTGLSTIILFLAKFPPRLRHAMPVVLVIALIILILPRDQIIELSTKVADAFRLHTPTADSQPEQTAKVPDKPSAVPTKPAEGEKPSAAPPKPTEAAKPSAEPSKPVEPAKPGAAPPAPPAASPLPIPTKEPERSITTAPPPVINSASQIVYYRKQADGDRIVQALTGARLAYTIGYSSLPDYFVTNAIACSANADPAVLKRLVAALLGQGVTIYDVFQFRSREKQGFEILAYTADRDRGQYLPYRPLSSLQLHSLDRCVNLSNDPS
jgi:hypothetical protein